MDPTSPSSGLESWRAAHRCLIEAIVVAKEAVASEKAQRRYWMEEICANLTPDGKLTTSSVWKRPPKPVKPRKAAPSKRKKPAEGETNEDGGAPSKKKKRAPKKKEPASKKQPNETKPKWDILKTQKIQPAANYGVKQFPPADMEEDGESNSERDEEDDDDDFDDDDDEAAWGVAASTQQQQQRQPQYASTDPSPTSSSYPHHTPSDMSHIPEELRPFMMAQAASVPPPLPPPPPHMTHGNPYASLAAAQYGDSEDGSSDES